MRYISTRGRGPPSLSFDEAMMTGLGPRMAGCICPKPCQQWRPTSKSRAWQGPAIRGGPFPE